MTAPCYQRGENWSGEAEESSAQLRERPGDYVERNILLRVRHKLQAILASWHLLVASNTY